MKIRSLNVYFEKRVLATYVVVAAILGSFLGGAMWNFFGLLIPESPISNILPHNSLQRFTSLEDLVHFLETRYQNHHYGGIAISPRGGFFKILTDNAVAVYSEAAAGQDGPDYSGTNIQVQGVDEADMVKTDGEYIYLASGRKVIIVKAFPPEEASIISVLDMDLEARDLFINRDKLVVIHSPDAYYLWYRWGVMPEEEYWFNTTVNVYDVSDRSSPTLERTVSIDGSYITSRMIEDYVYTVTRQPAILNISEAVLPRFRVNGYTFQVRARDVWYANNTDFFYGYTNIMAINVQNPEEWITHETFLLGYTSTIYASHENIYLTAPCWIEDEASGWESTMVYKVMVDKGDIEYVAEGAVPGRALNQFSMDEHEGNFRIATTRGHLSRGGSKTSSNVYVLNASLRIVGSLEGLAPGEKIYSARFMGNRCYLVTFKKVDPLFVIDLSEPENPQVLGKLKIPGYSDYLHPYDDNHLIGVGKETEEAEEGDFAWYQGVKVSLFDVSDVSKPKELAKYEIGDRGTDSPVLQDHKAFLFSRSKNLLVIPVLVAEINPQQYSSQVPPNAYGEYIYQGAYVFDISPETGINMRGRVTHIEDPQDFLKSGYWFESSYEVERSIYIEDFLYTISQGMIKMNNLDDLSEVGRVKLL